MPKVIFDISVSLDGLMTASGRTAAGPMGVGGQRLHEWAMGEDDLNRGLLERWVAEEGAAIAGRKTYDTSVPWWGADGPSGPARNPLLVFGAGARMFEGLPDKHIQLETIEVIETSAAIHHRFRVLSRGASADGE